MIEPTSTQSYVFWQTMITPDGDELPAEPAILIEVYDDTISLQQGEDRINLNHSSLDELLKKLKQLKK